MPVAVAELVLSIASLYLAIGVIFAALFIAVGLRRVDTIAASGPLRFKLLIAPGVAVLWPAVMMMWLRGGREGVA